MSTGLVYKCKTPCGSTIGHMNPNCIGTNTHICLTESPSAIISKNQICNCGFYPTGQGARQQAW